MEYLYTLQFDNRDYIQYWAKDEKHALKQALEEYPESTVSGIWRKFT